MSSMETPQARFTVAERSVVPQRQYPHVLSVIASTSKDQAFKEYMSKRDFGLSYLPQEKACQIAGEFREHFQNYNFQKHFGITKIVVSETDSRACRVESRCTVNLLHPIEDIPMSDSRVEHVFKLDHGLSGEFLHSVSARAVEDFNFSLKKGRVTIAQHKQMDDEFIIRECPEYLSNVDYEPATMPAVGARHALRQISAKLISAGIIDDLEKESNYKLPAVLKNLIIKKSGTFLRTPQATLLLRIIETSQTNDFTQEEFSRHIENYYGSKKEDSLKLDPRKASSEIGITTLQSLPAEFNIDFKNLLEEMLPPESKVRNSRSWDKLPHLIARASGGNLELVRQILGEGKDYDNHTELSQDIQSARRAKEDESVFIPEIVVDKLAKSEKRTIKRDCLFLPEYHQSISGIQDNSDLELAINRKIDGLLSTGNSRAQDTKKIKGYDDLFELRVRAPEEYRIYFTFHDRKIVFLHSGFKGTQDSNDLAKADAVRKRI